VPTIHGPRCTTPPHLLEHLLRNKDGDVRRAAMRTLLSTARLRGERTARASFAAAAAPANGRRTVFDCRHSTFLPLAVTARSEDGAASADVSVNRAFDGLGATRDFYRDLFDRNSIDGRACGSTDTCTTTAPIHRVDGRCPARGLLKERGRRLVIARAIRSSPPAHSTTGPRCR
jgi:hypothetical protein